MFRELPSVDRIMSVRRMETKDMVTRLGFLAPKNIRIANYSIEKPITVFNAGAYVDKDSLILYVRTVTGYYKYVSAIARVEIPLADIESKKFVNQVYDAEIVVYPSNKYDFWGAEDPRITLLNDRISMVYAGRTIKYFDTLMQLVSPEARYGKVLPIAALSRDGREWKKVAVFINDSKVRKYIVADKDAFLIQTSDSKLWLFHRPDTINNEYFITISNVEKLDEESLKEIELKNTYIALKIAPFEWKAGWSTPPLNMDKDRYVAILHGVDREMRIYRAFAALLKYEKNMFTIDSVTPYYIMEPKTIEEKYGDRPFVVFPTGLVQIDDKLLIIYGASDTFVGIGYVYKEELLEILERS